MAIEEKDLLFGSTPITVIHDTVTNRNAMLTTSSAAAAGTGGAITIADGADANAGTTTDAANTTGTTGTLSGKLRGLVSLLASVITTVSTIVHLKVGEQFVPVAEDNTNGVIAISSKPVVGSAYAALIGTGFGTVAAAFIKATPGNVRGIRATNINAAIRYAQLHNKATIPLAGETPLISIPIPAGSVTVPGVVSYGFNPTVYFSTGIGWAMSTTQATYTAATAADHNVLVEYV